MSQEVIQGAAEGAPAAVVVPSYEPSEAVKRTWKIIEQIELGRQDHARLTSDKLRRGVEIEAEIRQAGKVRDERLEIVGKIHQDEIIEANNLRDARCAGLEGAYEDLVDQRANELSVRQAGISKLDVRLEQLRKQLDAELAKIGAKVSG